MHHAYVYYGSLSHLQTLAGSARDFFDFKKENDPDVQILSFEKFGIEESRQLKESASMKPVSGRALYIVGVSQITSEAQQALLKLFEEPQEGVTFVLLAPHGSLLQTLRSRLLQYAGRPGALSLTSTGSATDNAPGLAIATVATKFLASPYKTRSTDITKLLKDDEGVRERVRDFLDGLEVVLYKALQKSKENKEVREGLEDIAKVRSYANDRSPSFKMLLEHLALALPKIN